MKIVLFGDSMLARFNNKLIDQLEEKIADSEVYNCAAGGWDTDDCAKKAPYIGSLKPDMVIVSLGTNDGAAWKQVPLERFKINLNAILDDFKDSRVVFFPAAPVNESRQNPDFGRINDLMHQYFDATKEVCIRRGIEYIDSWAIFHPLLEKGEDYHIDDGVHFNDHGNDILIDKIASHLKT